MNITYLLGAGASANAIPVVEKSNYRIELFLHILNQDLEKYSLSEKLRKKGAQKHESFLNIYKKIKFHLSYDTYAKKLWLKGLEKELLELKEFMSFYYYYEHLPNKFRARYVDNFILENYKLNGEQIKKEYFDICRDQQDKRYDAFFAGIADKKCVETVFIPDNINIVTWNYDLQMEMALSSYDTGFIDCSFDPYKLKRDEINSPLQRKIVKLNGSCGYKIQTIDGIHYNLERYFKGFNIDSCEDLYKIMVGDWELDIETNYHTNINFSWEENKYSNQNLGVARTIFSKTDGLVVVGYSFPLFNREVDKKLFSELNIASNSKIYVQTLSEDEFKRIKSRIKGIMNIDDKNIEFIEDKNQFFVPFELNESAKNNGVKMVGYNYEDL